MTIDGAAIRASRVRSQAFARDWISGADHRALAARFAALPTGDVVAAAEAATALLADGSAIGALLAPMIDRLRDDAWFEPPLRASRDALKTGAVLFDASGVSIALTVVSAATLAAQGEAASAIVPGRVSVVRYVRSGGGRVRRWAVEPATADFSAVTAGRCVALPDLAIADGMVVRMDGRTHAHLLSDARDDVVTVTATLRAGQGPVMREYRVADGTLLRSAMLDEDAARTTMLLTLLRAGARADAGACFAAATRGDAFFLRWAAMREWLATDVRAALPRLVEMAAGDPHDEVRAAARATLVQVDAMMAGAG